MTICWFSESSFIINSFFFFGRAVRTSIRQNMLYGNCAKYSSLFFVTDQAIYSYRKWSEDKLIMNTVTGYFVSQVFSLILSTTFFFFLAVKEASCLNLCDVNSPSHWSYLEQKNRVNHHFRKVWECKVSVHSCYSVWRFTVWPSWGRPGETDENTVLKLKWWPLHFFVAMKSMHGSTD